MLNKSVVFLFFICTNTIILGATLQAQTVAAEDASPDTAAYHLDVQTIRKGYPAFSKDKLFTLVVPQEAFDEPVDVSIAPFELQQGTTTSLTLPIRGAYNFFVSYSKN